MLSHSHHKEADSSSTTKTQGAIMDWGWFYDLTTAFFARVVLGGSERALRQGIVDLARIQPGETILDVGCGTGSLALVAKERVGATGRVYGIDPGARQIARAHAKAEKAGLSIDFRFGVIEQLAFPDQSLDVVLSSFMMHHLPDDLKRRGLTEIARVLKPGGRLLVVDFKPSRHPTPIPFIGPHGVGPWNSNIDDLPVLMKEAGFSHIESGATPFKGSGFALGSIEKA